MDCQAKKDLFVLFSRKKCIMSEPKFDFLKGLVANIPCGPTGPEEMGSSSSGSQTPTSLSPQTTSQSSNFTFSTSRLKHSFMVFNRMLITELFLKTVSGHNPSKLQAPDLTITIPVRLNNGRN